MGVLSGLTGSQGNSVNNSTSASSSRTQTYADYANSAAKAAAEHANQLAVERWKMAADFNAAEAEKNRQWQQENINTANEMANTVYSRSMKDMINAGLNPVLAAGAGLGAAGAGSTSGGASASMAAADTYMPQTFMDTISSSESQSQSHGSSKSESGLATGLQLLGEAIGGVLQNLSSANKIEIALQGFDKIFNTDTNRDGKVKGDEKVAETISPFIGKTPMQVLDMFMSDSSKKREAIYGGNNKNTPSYKYSSPGRMNEASWGQ